MNILVGEWYDVEGLGHAIAEASWMKPQPCHPSTATTHPGHGSLLDTLYCLIHMPLKRLRPLKIQRYELLDRRHH